jgi:hypothetical protein
MGAGATIMGAMASPVLGPAGNAEYLLWARAGSPGRPVVPSADEAAALDLMLDAAVAASPDAPSPPDAVLRDTASVHDTASVQEDAAPRPSGGR